MNLKKTILEVELLKHTPLSNAVIAGRTAWQSWHKGGNYKSPTDNITEEDYNFLRRLFNKYKHLSVSEHIWYTFKIKNIDPIDLLKIKNEYNFYSIKDNYCIFSVNLRTILEELDSNYQGCESVKNFYEKLFFYLPNIHSSLILNKEYAKINATNINFQLKEVENEIGHKVQLIYHYNVKENVNFERRPHNFTALRLKGFSRAVLQELVRHDDLLAITAKSTRYTLKELKNELKFDPNNPDDIERAKKYIVIVPDMDRSFTTKQILQLELLREEVVKGISNDKVKYLLPESYRTEVLVTYNILNLDNLLKLRLDKSALWEINFLAQSIKKVTIN
jgi:thymidylate synthase ThyX